ncbi:hypothetical protein OsI_15351 [Oryza sativa Indica Group]|uniref:Uncharacterized protein n=1 Tax=Oryza sativa subsp. indica TaxID=39946 RepID=B8AS91_ORYSI|nr:hypothetical protein OsI_15351 [Oryza sativa Indica Group]
MSHHLLRSCQPPRRSGDAGLLPRRPDGNGLLPCKPAQPAFSLADLVAAASGAVDPPPLASLVDLAMTMMGGPGPRRGGFTCVSVKCGSGVDDDGGKLSSGGSSGHSPGKGGFAVVGLGCGQWRSHVEFGWCTGTP